jgi:hypothetical protein
MATDFAAWRDNHGPTRWVKIADYRRLTDMPGICGLFFQRRMLLAIHLASLADLRAGIAWSGSACRPIARPCHD